MSVPNTELYDILGLTPNATMDEVKSAYRKLVKTCHPDLPDNRTPEKELLFKKVSRAHETLSDPDKRAYYDSTGNVEGVASETDRIEKDALNTLTNLFMMAAPNIAEPAKVSPLSVVYQEINERVSRAKAGKAAAIGQLGTLQAVQHRLKRKDGAENNPLANLLAAKIKEQQQEIAKFDYLDKMVRRTLQLLNEYEYKTDPINTSGYNPHMAPGYMPTATNLTA